MVSKNAPAVPRRRYADFCNKICTKRTYRVRSVMSAFERTDRCAATPLEITSRSASVNASLERRRWAGRIPPCGMLQAIQWRPWADEQVYGLTFLQGKGVKISNPASEAASRDRDPRIQRR